ncbi:MAG: DUF89 domain-containing protein [Smithellaceae bacterium]
MKISLDCITCFVRQTLEVSRMVSPDTVVQERIMREVLLCISEMDMDKSPPFLAQHIHRRLREITGVADPYRTAKEKHNQLALNLLSEMKTRIDAASDPFYTAAKLAIAANIIDLGAKNSLPEVDVLSSLIKAANEPIVGQLGYSSFRKAIAHAGHILYLADNAGEIVFDRLLIEKISPQRVTLVVRGAPAINDATIEDARSAGLHEIVKIIDNGSDAPGTILDGCSEKFKKYFAEADVVISKGQGNFETLSDERREIFFLFKAKCPIVASHVGLPVGTNILARSNAGILETGGVL